MWRIARGYGLGGWASSGCMASCEGRAGACACAESLYVNVSAYVSECVLCDNLECGACSVETMQTRFTRRRHSRDRVVRLYERPQSTVSCAVEV